MIIQDGGFTIYKVVLLAETILLSGHNYRYIGIKSPCRDVLTVTLLYIKIPQMSTLFLWKKLDRDPSEQIRPSSLRHS